MSGVGNEVFSALEMQLCGGEVGRELNLPCKRVTVPVVFWYLHGQP